MADALSLAACGIAPTLLAALFKAGFRSTADLDGVTARELANEAKIDAKDAVTVLESVRCSPSCVRDVGVSALDVLQQAAARKPIATRLETLDAILDGGVRCGELTEICGGPGIGKTQLGIHLCLAAQSAFDATRVTAIYIDSEGSFLIERVAHMATAFSNDFPLAGTRALDRDDLLRGITYFRVHDYLEQIEVLHALPTLLHAQPDCKLLVLDTVAFHFRHGFDDFVQRTRALDGLAMLLHRLAVDYHIAVVLTNHLTTKSALSTQQSAVETPALGESWSHAITTRVLLAWENASRVARITKSSTQAHRAAPFEISERGVRDVLE